MNTNLEDYRPKPLTCEKCGAPIDRNTMRCPYCRTEYQRKTDMGAVNIRVDRRGTRIIECQARISDDMAANCPEGATEYALSQMRRQVADTLLSFMEMKAEKHSMGFDPLGNYTIIRGRITVVDPAETMMPILKQRGSYIL